MSINEFFKMFYKEIIISTLFAIICIGLLVFLSIVQTREKKSTKSIVVGLVMIIIVLFGATFSLIRNEINFIKIAIVDLLIVGAYTCITYLLISSRKNQKITTKMNTATVAFLGIIIGLASVLMMFSIPIFPMAHYLKLELSGLLIFMVLLWYDFKTAIIVSLLTNLIHVFLPSNTPPVILFLDEGVNFIATMVYIIPTAFLMTKMKTKPARSNIIITTLIGTIFTTIFMVAFNAYINLPLIYKINLPFNSVLQIFGVFNIIKWGSVSLIINILWIKLFNIRNLKEQI